MRFAFHIAQRNVTINPCLGTLVVPGELSLRRFSGKYGASAGFSRTLGEGKTMDKVPRAMAVSRCAVV